MRKRTKRNDETTIKASLLKKNMARALLFLNAVLWLGYTVYIYFDMAVVNHNELSADVTTVFVFVNAVIMFVSGMMLGKQQKFSFYFALVVIVLNIILTVANVADAFFMLAFVIDLIILWLLFQLRKDYLSNP